MILSQGNSENAIQSERKSSDKNVVQFSASLENNVPTLKTWNGPPGRLSLPRGRGDIHYFEKFLDEKESMELFNAVNDTKNFQRTIITSTTRKMTYFQPRDTLFYGDVKYSYGGEQRDPLHWDEDPPASSLCKKVANKIEIELGLEKDYFNVVLVNKYDKGSDFMEWHADNEQNLGHDPIIASLSIGQVRDFLFRPTVPALEGNPVEIIKYTLLNGSLLVMSGKMQKYYQHSVPPTPVEKTRTRINFTFRRVVDKNNFSVFQSENSECRFDLLHHNVSNCSQ